MEHVIKHFEPRSKEIEKLEAILRHSGITSQQKKNIEQEIRNIKAGDAAEKSAGYLLEQRVKNHGTSFLIHNLRLVLDDDVCQIDHLTLNRHGVVTLFETKSFSTGIKITEEGEFLRWDQYRKSYIEIPSPIAQSQRHERVLKKYLDMLNFTAIEFRHVVLVDYKAKIIKPKSGFELVCRPDRIDDALEKHTIREGTLKTIGLVGKMLLRTMSMDNCRTIALKLASYHEPIEIDFAAKFGITNIKEENNSIASKESPLNDDSTAAPANKNANTKLSTSKIAKKLGMSTNLFEDALTKHGFFEDKNGRKHLTSKAKSAGIEFKKGWQGYYFLFPEEFTLPDDNASNEKLTTAKLAQKFDMQTKELESVLISKGFFELKNGNNYLTDKAKQRDVEFRRGRGGFFFVFPADFTLD